MKAENCINCGQALVAKNGATVCLRCNSEALVQSEMPFENGHDSDEFLYIECHGATVYDNSTMSVTQGVLYADENDPDKGYTIVDKPLFAPMHTKLRRIKREAFGRIRRCQACQDLTIRLRRPEGVDFCIPSARFPNRKKLRSVMSSESD